MTAKTLAAAAVAALAIAGCGGAGSSSTSSSAEDAPALAYARCMRAHGVSNFPDPIPGHKAQFPDSPIFASQAPVVLSAKRACKAQLAAIIGTGAGPSTNQDAAFLEYARCMRAHGVPNYPDPTYAKTGRPNAPDLSGQGIDPQSPAFISAAKACSGHGIPLDQGVVER
jgi:hypothetical protein